MSWIIKRGRFEYVLANSMHVDVYLKRHVEWTDDQALAHRYDDRNQAANLVGYMPAADDVRVVRLVPRIRRRGEP